MALALRPIEFSECTIYFSNFNSMVDNDLHWS